MIHWEKSYCEKLYDNRKILSNFTSNFHFTDRTMKNIDYSLLFLRWQRMKKHKNTRFFS